MAIELILFEVNNYTSVNNIKFYIKNKTSCLFIILRQHGFHKNHHLIGTIHFF